MANYASLKAAIQQVVKTNGNNEITGALLQQTLFAMVDSLGGYYQFAGIASPSTNPGSPDQNVYYIASTAGTYTNFGGLVLADGEIAILKYNGAWSKDSTGAASQEMVNQLGYYVTDTDYIRAYVDSSGKFLFGIKTDGSIEWAVGVPTPVKKHIEELATVVATKVDKISGKSLIDAEVASALSFTTDDDYINAITDAEGKILEAIKNNGDKVFFGGVSAPSMEANEVDFAGRKLSTSKIDGYILACLDAGGKMVYGIKENGELDVPIVPQSVKSFVAQKIATAEKDADTVVNRNLYKEPRVVQSFFHGRSNPKKKNLTFVWGSDFHGCGVALRNMYLYGENYDGILFSLNTGDTQSASPIDTNILPDASIGIIKPILNVIGNHDNGFGADATKMATAKQKYDRFIAPFLSNGQFTQPADVSDFPCYYYKDFPNYKIRVLVVDIYEAPKITYNGGQIANQDSPCISEKQANFICDSLTSLPSDYAVIVAMHTKDAAETIINEGKFTDPSVTIGNIDTGFSMDYPVVTDIITAFVNKGTLSKTYTFTGSVYDALNANNLPTSYEISVDFSSRNESEFICFFAGHQHKDIVGHHNLQLDVYVINGGYFERDQSFSDISRLSHGLTQDSFNVVSIDRDNRKVNLVRIGADITMDFAHRDMIQLDY